MTTSRPADLRGVLDNDLCWNPFTQRGLGVGRDPNAAWVARPDTTTTFR